MNEGSRKTTLVVGAVAAAAGVAIASYIYMLRLRASAAQNPPLRSVTEVLNDCYAKMRELQEHVSELNGPALRPSRKRA